MLLASYDVTNQKATVMSIPRDTMVNVPWDIKRINSVYNYYGGGEKGIKALYKEIASSSALNRTIRSLSNGTPSARS